MKIYNVNDEHFHAYGRVIKDIDLSELLEEMDSTPLTDEVVYEPSVDELECLEAARRLQTCAFGELPIQVGYCNGNNLKLNALEYHRSSEINIGATDAILILGRQQDITCDLTYDTSLAEAFFLPKGTAVELYATTLHYAPCTANKGGFRVTVVLPKGTNYPLKSSHSVGEDGHLTAVNKWLFGHPEGGLPEGSPMGLIGKNLDVSE